jgi:hypothetical protein
VSVGSFEFRLAHGALNFRLDGDLGESVPNGVEGEEGPIERAASLCLRLRVFVGMAGTGELCSRQQVYGLYLRRRSSEASYIK